MRFSIDRDDPGYRNFLASSRTTAKVWLDGVLMQGVVTADDVKGEVVRYKKDDRGLFILSADRASVIRETLHGHVEIE